MRGWGVLVSVVVCRHVHWEVYVDAGVWLGGCSDDRWRRDWVLGSLAWGEVACGTLVVAGIACRVSLVRGISGIYHRFYCLAFYSIVSIIGKMFMFSFDFSILGG